MADGFLGRWSQRKQEVREGRPLAEPVRPSPQPSPAGGRGSQSGPSRQPFPGEGPQVIHQEGSSPLPQAGEGRGEGAVNVPAPTLEDVQVLTPQSDFKPFMARDVDPEVKNAAMKKLFADPHFNVMDGLDTYIDDYSKPDPLPLSMMRKMASAQFLKLFDDDEKAEPAEQASRNEAGPTATPVAVTATPPQDPSDPAPTAGPQRATQDHAHTDLRLQQDHAAEPEGPGRGAG